MTQTTATGRGKHAGTVTGRLRAVRRICVLLLGAAALAACASLPQRDPLVIDVAGIESLPGEGMELRLLVRLRVQNPNDRAVDYDGVALALDLNGTRLASGVSSDTGSVPRYGETVIEMPMTISAFDMARHVIGLRGTAERDEIDYRIRGKLAGGLFGTRRFTDEGSFRLDGSGAM